MDNSKRLEDLFLYIELMGTNELNLQHLHNRLQAEINFETEANNNPNENFYLNDLQKLLQTKSLELLKKDSSSMFFDFVADFRKVVLDAQTRLMDV